MWFSKRSKQSRTSAVQTLNVGDKVRKVGGDYVFDGVIVSSFLKISGKVRYVVEDDRGILHIFSEKNLKLLEES